METLTIEYDARNEATKQIITGLVSIGVFRIKKDVNTVSVSQEDSQRQKILSFAGAFSDMNEETYSMFMNEIKQTRNNTFNRNIAL
jgi:predicted transcriptional regulator YheO